MTDAATGEAGHLIIPAVELVKVAGELNPDAAERMLDAAADLAAATWHSLENSTITQPNSATEEAQADCVLIIGLYQLLQGRNSSCDLPIPAEAVTRAARVLARRADSAWREGFNDFTGVREVAS